MMHVRDAAWSRCILAQAANYPKAGPPSYLSITLTGIVAIIVQRISNSSVHLATSKNMGGTGEIQDRENAPGGLLDANKQRRTRRDSTY